MFKVVTTMYGNVEDKVEFEKLEDAEKYALDKTKEVLKSDIEKGYVKDFDSWEDAEEYFYREAGTVKVRIKYPKK